MAVTGSAMIACGIYTLYIVLPHGCPDLFYAYAKCQWLCACWSLHFALVTSRTIGTLWRQFHK